MSGKRLIMTPRQYNMANPDGVIIISSPVCEYCHEKTEELAATQAQNLELKKAVIDFEKALDNLADASAMYGEENQYGEPNNILEMHSNANKVMSKHSPLIQQIKQEKI